METHKEIECCSDSNCGCQITNFPTDEKCPSCDKRLRLTGNSQSLMLRLTCPNCGYQSPLLSQAKLQELL